MESRQLTLDVTGDPEEMGGAEYSFTANTREDFQALVDFAAMHFGPGVEDFRMALKSAQERHPGSDITVKFEVAKRGKEVTYTVNTETSHISFTRKVEDPNWFRDMVEEMHDRWGDFTWDVDSYVIEPAGDVLTDLRDGVVEDVFDIARDVRRGISGRMRNLRDAVDRVRDRVGV